jgi:hypothetical protein
MGKGGQAGGASGMTAPERRPLGMPTQSGRRRIWTARAALVLLPPLLLAACTVPAAPALRRGTADFSPADLSNHYWIDTYVSTSNFLNNCALFPVHDQTRRPPAGRLLVGADNHFDPGTNPFPCILKNDWAYRGGVRFDLSTLVAMKRIVIEKAVLTWTIESAVVRDGDGHRRGVASGPDATNCVDAVLESTRSIFSEGDFLPGLSLRAGQGDVTSLVTTWVVDKARNFGFVLVGLDESYSRNNAACLNTIGNLSLHIDFLAP